MPWPSVTTNGSAPATAAPHQSSVAHLECERHHWWNTPTLIGRHLLRVRVEDKHFRIISWGFISSNGLIWPSALIPSLMESHNHAPVRHCKLWWSPQRPWRPVCLTGLPPTVQMRFQRPWRRGTTLIWLIVRALYWRLLTKLIQKLIIEEKYSITLTNI